MSKDESTCFRAISHECRRTIHSVCVVVGLPDVPVCCSAAASQRHEEQNVPGGRPGDALLLRQRVSRGPDEVQETRPRLRLHHRKTRAYCSATSEVWFIAVAGGAKRFTFLEL